MKEKYNSDYQIQKAVENEEIFKVDKGLYPNAIYTMDSAFYFQDLTDVIQSVLDYFRSLMVVEV